MLGCAFYFYSLLPGQFYYLPPNQSLLIIYTKLKCSEWKPESPDDGFQKCKIAFKGGRLGGPDLQYLVRCKWASKGVQINAASIGFFDTHKDPEPLQAHFFWGPCCPRVKAVPGSPWV